MYSSQHSVHCIGIGKQAAVSYTVKCIPRIFLLLNAPVISLQGGTELVSLKIDK